MVVVGCWLLSLVVVVGCCRQLVVVGSWLLVVGCCWMLDVGCWTMVVVVLPIVNALDFRYFLQAEEQAVPAVDTDSFSSQADRSSGVLYAESWFPGL